MLTLDYKEIRNNLDRMSKRSAWERGVNSYAKLLVDQLCEHDVIEGMHYRFEKTSEIEGALLNGAKNWSQFSWGGCAYVYDEDIASTLCTPSELKRKKGGDLKPNKDEDWLDVQARALQQAARRVIVAILNTQFTIDVEIDEIPWTIGNQIA